MSNIAGNIVFLRKRSGHTQAEMSASLDVPITTYASWEYGKAEPSTEKIMAICEIFDIPVNDFLKKNLATEAAGVGQPAKNDLNRRRGKKDTPVQPVVREAGSSYQRAAPGNVKQLLNDKDQLIKAQQIAIEALQKQLQMAEELIKQLRKSPF